MFGLQIWKRKETKGKFCKQLKKTFLNSWMSAKIMLKPISKILLGVNTLELLQGLSLLEK
jgi:hypothetical protein